MVEESEGDPMKEKIKRMNRSLFELEVGILMFALLGQIVLLFFPERGLYSVSWWIGIATAAVSAADMWWALEHGLSMENEGATRKIIMHSMIRYVAIAVVLVLVAMSDRLNPLVTFIGIMGLKIGAYLNFLAKKISNRIYGKEVSSTPKEMTEENK